MASLGGKAFHFARCCRLVDAVEYRQVYKVRGLWVGHRFRYNLVGMICVGNGVNFCLWD